MHDLIIIGAGPAGLTASIYASCYKLSHLVIGKMLGGQLQYATHILNYPGFEEISGKELTEKMVNQVKKRGGEIVTQSITRISKIGNLQQNSNEKKQDIYELETEQRMKYQARAIILATGMERRKLNVPGEIEYTSRGVYYCATCEKEVYQGKICAVVGGANSALQAAVELVELASKVYIIYRGSEFRGDKVWFERIKNHPKVEIMLNTVITEIKGDGKKVTGVKLQSTMGSIQRVNLGQAFVYPKESQNESSMANENFLPLDKIFIEIGGVPGTALVIPLGVAMDDKGYIKVDDKLATNIPGIFAAGDLVSYGLSIEQISTAIGLGARAAASAFAYLSQKNAPTVWGQSQIKR